MVVFTFTDKWWDWERDGFGGVRGHRPGCLADRLASDPRLGTLLVVDVPSSVFRPGWRRIPRESAPEGAECVREGAAFSLWRVRPGAFVLDHRRLMPAERHHAVAYSINAALHDAALVAEVRSTLAALGARDVVSLHMGPLTAHLMGRLGERACVYDAVDEWLSHPAYRGMRTHIRRGYDRIRRDADLIAAVSQPLADSFAGSGGLVRLLPNGVGAEWSAASAAPLPEDIATLPRPIVGYTGSLQQRVDVDLLGSVAAARPDASFCLVGPLLAPSHFASVRGMPNVHFLGMKDHRVLHRYVAAFDACVVPHVDSPLTRAMDPVKLYEYAAAGKPTVVTGVPDAERFGEAVRAAANAGEFVSHLAAAVSGDWKVDAASAARFLSENTWECRVERLLDLIEEAAARRGRRDPVRASSRRGTEEDARGHAVDWG